MSHTLSSEGSRKYPASLLLRSSDHLGWSTLFAEFRSHSSCEGPGAEGQDLEVAVIVNGSDQGAVTCKVGAEQRKVCPSNGTIWLNPMAARADAIRIASPELEVAQLVPCQNSHSAAWKPSSTCLNSPDNPSATRPASKTASSTRLLCPFCEKCQIQRHLGVCWSKLHPSFCCAAASRALRKSAASLATRAKIWA